MKSEVIIGDCIDILPKFPDNTFDLAILDPPYYKIINAKWDRQWKTLEDYIAIEKEEKYLPIIQERGKINEPTLYTFDG